MDRGSEPITDAAVRAAVLRQARRVQLRAILATASMTVPYLLFS